MKQVLFILLVFISVNGFSQSVKMNISYNIEVMKTDLGGEMTWDEAKTAVDKLGSFWRLPSNAELQFMYDKRDEIGGFVKDECCSSFWSSTELLEGSVDGLAFYDGSHSLIIKSLLKSRVRAVRTIK